MDEVVKPALTEPVAQAFSPMGRMGAAHIPRRGVIRVRTLAELVSEDSA